MQRYLIFVIGILVLVVVLAPSLGTFANTAAGTPGETAQGAPGDGAGLPMLATPGVATPGVAKPGAPGFAGAPVAGGGALVLMRDPGGQFRGDASVNDQPVRFVIDTGADGVALSEADARGVGVLPDPATYRQVVTTASGPGYGAHVRIDRLQIGGHVLHDIDAVVVRGLGTSLLGQTALRQLGPVTIVGDRMTIGD